jgi:hypothetical protein
MSDVKAQMDELLAEWASLIKIVRLHGSGTGSEAFATRAIEDQINRYLNRRQAMTTTAHYVVVARHDYENGRRVVSLQPFSPELTSGELDTISDEDYEALMDKWEPYGFTIRSNDKDGDVGRYPHEIGVVQVETDEDWTPGTVLRLTVEAIGQRADVESVIRPNVTA